MKRLVVFLIVLLFAATAHGDWTAWVLWGSENQSSVEARFGYETDTVEIAKIEAGILSRWWPYDRVPQVAGGYGIISAPEPMELPNPLSSVFPWMGETILAVPYGGGSVGLDFFDDTKDRGFSSIIGGAEILGDDKLSIGVEWARYDYKDNLSVKLDDEDVLFLFAKIRF